MAEQRAWHHASAQELPGVLVTAGRLFARHWPAFVVLSCLGVAVRNGAIWAAVVVSDKHSILAQFLLILAPLGFLLPVIAMLHLCRGSVPGAASTSDAKTPRGGLLDISVAVLIPFLTVYVANGFLDQDRLEFLSAASLDEYDQQRGKDLFGPTSWDAINQRIGYYPLLTVLAIVVVAFVVRWAVGRFQKKWSFLALAALGALVEVYWTGVAARYASDAQGRLAAWIDERRAVHVVTERYDAAVGSLGPVAHPVDTATTWLLGLFGSLDAVVIVPLAWLTVAAVVLGRQLTPAQVRRHPVLDRIPALPPRARRAAESFTADLRSRWAAFWNGLKIIGAAGLLPMLVFCIAFLLALRVPWLFSQAMRHVIGPVDAWAPWSPIEGGFGMAVQMVVLAPLLAAAIAWLVRPVERQTVDLRPADRA